MRKHADIGGKPSENFEKTFANAAYVFVKDKIPRLMDYLVGFQLLDRSEDNKKAAGIFGFKVNGQWMYVPVFFLNGSMKGHELLYIKDKDLFVPCKENWVNYLLRKEGRELGTPARESILDLSAGVPNIRQIALPPPSYKYSSFDEGVMTDWVKEILPSVGRWITTNPLRLKKYAGIDERVNLKTFALNSEQFCRVLAKAYLSHNKFAAAVDKFYGKSFIENALRYWEGKKRVSVLDKPQNKLASTSILPIENKLEIYTFKDIGTDRSRVLSGEEKEKLVKEGIVIRDKRAEDSVSTVFDVPNSGAAKSLNSISRGSDDGLYNVYLASGEKKRLLKCREIKTYAGSDNDNAYMYDPETDVLYKFPSGYADAIAFTDNAVPGTDIESFSRPISELAQALDEELENRKRKYKNNEITYIPRTFDVILLDKHNGRLRAIYVDLDDPKTISNKDISCYRVQIGIDDKAKRLTYSKATLGSYSRNLEIRVPSTARFILVKETDHPVLPVLDLYGATEKIAQYTEPLEITSSGKDFYINGEGPFSRVRTKIALVRDWGLREKDVDKLFNKVSGVISKYRVRVKRAVSAPVIDETTFYYDPGFKSTVQEPYENFTNLGPIGQDASTLPSADPSFIDSKTLDNISNTASLPAEEDLQKQVFDASTLSSLLRNVRSDSIIDRYLPDLIKSLDRLCRILFQFYWHNDKFMERYGKSDLPDLEDSLRNTIEALGDLTIFLKEKEADTGLELDIGTPTVEEII